MSSRKLPPKWQTTVAPEPPPVEGVDNLPIPMGVSATARKLAERDSEATPGAMGQKNSDHDCDGDNPTIKDIAPFATGQDVRSYGASPSSDPNPGKPGAR